MYLAVHTEAKLTELSTYHAALLPGHVKFVPVYFESCRRRDIIASVVVHKRLLRSWFILRSRTPTSQRSTPLYNPRLSR